MRTLKIALLSLWTIISFAQEPSNENFFYKLEDHLSEFRNNNIHDVDIIFNRSFYAPGDFVKFGIINYDWANRKDLTFNCFIFNSNGDIIFDEIKNLITAISLDSIQLPINLDEGNYSFLYYCKQGNGISSTFFKKQFEVRTQNSDLIRIKLLNEKGNNIKLMAMLPSGFPVEDISLDVIGFIKNKEILKLTSKTNKEGIATFQVGKISEPVQLLCKAKYKNSKHRQSFVIYPESPLSKINFNVEGNTLIPGTPKLICASGTDAYGFPSNFEGIVKDPNGNELANFKSDSTGKAFFYVIAPKTDKLLASIKDFSNKIEIPVNNDGVSLSLIKIQHDSVFLKMENGNTDVTRTIKLALLSKNKSYWGSIVNIKQSGILKLPYKDVPSGIINILVFDETNKIVARRLINTRVEDSSILSVKTNQSVYNLNELIKVHIHSLAPMNEALLVSGNEVPIMDESTGLRYSLIQGKLTEINKYLICNSEINEVPQNIYNENIVDNDSNNKIRGYVFDRKKNHIANAVVTIKSNDDSEIKLNSNENGYFESNLQYKDNQDLNIHSEKNNIIVISPGKDNLQYELKNNPVILLEKNKVINVPDFSSEKNILTTVLEQKEFNKKLYKTKSKEEFKEDYKKIKDIKDIIFMIKPYRIIDGKIVFSNGYISNNQTPGARFVIDGFLKSDNIGEIGYLSGNDIEKIRILTDPSEVSRYSGFAPNGIIEITTKGSGWNNEINKEPAQKKEISSNNVYLLKLENNNTIFSFKENKKGHFSGFLIGISSDGKIINSSFNYEIVDPNEK